MDRRIIRKRTDRNILTIYRCSECNYSLLCGGSCVMKIIKKCGTLDHDKTYDENIKSTLKSIFSYYLPVLERKVDLTTFEKIAGDLD